MLIKVHWFYVGGVNVRCGQNIKWTGKLIYNIRIIRRLPADEAHALSNPNYTHGWGNVPDAARREGLPSKYR